MQKLLRLEFIPLNSDLALLVLRLALGGSMFWLHGSGKLMNLIKGNTQFADPIGIGETPSLLLAILAEAICSALLVLGLYTRLAALVLAITMGVAFMLVHDGRLSGANNGELPFVYCMGFVSLLLAGAGKYSVDRR